ncbi:MAG: holo-ACP synthase [Coriobacteriia bacterium]|nr:holo-ACP synthase [Coriobacteriia bacterium]
MDPSAGHEVPPSLGVSAMSSSPASPQGSTFGILGERVLAGVNVVELSRVARAFERTPRLKTFAFTDLEREHCESLAQPIQGYAARFAAKMAVCKALGITLESPVHPRAIEVSATAKGRPLARLSGRAKAFAQTREVLEIPLSLSYTHDEAVACAMAITQASLTGSRERVDQRRELAKKFREARSLLDELDVVEPAPTQESLPGIR